MFYIIFDFTMAVIMFLFGIWFYKSNGNTAKFLSGYNIRTKEERKKYDEKSMCIAYGRRMMIMSLPFVMGALIDIQHNGIGCLVAWVIWLTLFIILLVERHQKER